MVTAPAATSTGSLNVIVTSLASATWVAPLPGLVPVTDGAASAGGPPHGVPPFDAPGVIAARPKSFALLSVSQPSGVRASPSPTLLATSLVAFAPSVTPAIGSPPA